MTEIFQISSGEYCRSMALMAIMSLCCQFEVCVHANDIQSKSFCVSVDLRKGVFFHLFFSYFTLTGWTSSAKIVSLT